MHMRLLYLVLVSVTSLGVTAVGGDVRQTLAALQEEEEWGEARMGDGVVRPLRVLSLSADSVGVTEVIGALYERPATYALNEIESVRVLGPHRIPRNPAPYRGARSAWKALGLELVIPGGGFFYLGQPRQGWSLMFFSAVAVATGISTGKDGAAGWVPIAVWTKAASLAQVRDEAGAARAAHDAGLDQAGDSLPRTSISLLRVRVPF